MLSICTLGPGEGLSIPEAFDRDADGSQHSCRWGIWIMDASGIGIRVVYGLPYVRACAKSDWNSAVIVKGRETLYLE